MSRSASIILCTAVAALVVIGLVMLASTSVWVKNVESEYYFVTRQCKMLVVGLVGAFFLSRLDPIWLRKTWPYALAILCLLLVLCFAPGVGVAELGSARWVKIPLLGKFQPSEMAKVVCVVVMAG